MTDTPPDVAEVAAELARVRAQAQAALEEAQVANEELQAANQELVAREEELRQAHDQLLMKAAELETVGNDLTCLLASTHIAVLFLDPEHRVRRFTPAVKDVIDLIPADVGRALTDLRWKFADPDFLADA